MERKLTSKVISGLLATGFLGATLLPTKPATADVVKDAAVGAAANVVTGAVLKSGSTVGNAVGGAAAGAAVSATHNKSNGRAASIVQDGAVGAAATVITGKILKNGKTLDNAVGGAAAGVVVNVSKD